MLYMLKYYFKNKILLLLIPTSHESISGRFSDIQLFQSQTLKWVRKTLILKTSVVGGDGARFGVLIIFHSFSFIKS